MHITPTDAAVGDLDINIVLAPRLGPEGQQLEVRPALVGLRGEALECLGIVRHCI